MQRGTKREIGGRKKMKLEIGNLEMKTESAID